MENQSIMDKFNEMNSFNQKLLFLRQKYASLLEWRTENWKKNFINLINGFLDEEDKIKINDGEDILCDLKRQWFLLVLSKINPDNLDKVLWMLAKSDKNIQDQNSLNDFNSILLNSLLEDLNQFKAVKNQIKDLEDGKTGDYKNKKLFLLISKAIWHDLKDVLWKWREVLEEDKLNIKTKWLKNFSVKYDEDGNVINSEDMDNDTEILDNDFLDSVRKNFTDPIVFFHTVQRIYQKYNYVITARELWNLKKIFSDIKNQKMIFLTWDTWSGKTELCLLIANLYLDEVYKNSWDRKNKEPVIITGNSETDFSDFTMEKIVTSENYLSSSDDAIEQEDTMENKVKNFVDNINKSSEFKNDVKKIIEENMNLSQEQKDEQCKQIDKEDLLEYHIFTKYHLQWIIKAMKNWVPLIIDEMNGIRPEVLLWLNHYFTRKVWQEVSLWNGFSPIIVKEWFCIMCTWNDKDENSNAKRYRWRYTIDESLMNRMHRICKWYHNQEIKKFDNENAWEFVDNKDMFDFMSENELYGVILMLLFSKKQNVKFNNIQKYDSESATKSLIHTEVTGFDIIKEKYVGVQSNKEKKDMFFDDLKKLAHFIKLVQDAFQWNVTMCDGKDISNMMQNSSWFSMRNVLDILNDYRNDTKSMWYHLYENYIKQIPEANDARTWAYLIAKEVWFLEKDTAIAERDNKVLTGEIEKKLLEEKSMNFELMDAHNKKVEVNSDLLTKWRIIITKQDMYKHYFGTRFGQWIDIDDKKFDEFMQMEENNQEKEENEEKEESEWYSVFDITASCDDILGKLDDESYSKFFQNLNFSLIFVLKAFCEAFREESKLEKYNQDEVNELARILNKISNSIESDDDGDMEDLVNNLQKFNEK